MPPFLFISASAYLAPSTSLCASAESTPVSGLTMPILTGVSPLAVMMKGDENCAAAIAAPDFRIVRRLIDQGRFEKAMQSSRKVIMSVLTAFSDPLRGAA